MTDDHDRLGHAVGDARKRGTETTEQPPQWLLEITNTETRRLHATPTTVATAIWQAIAEHETGRLERTFAARLRAATERAETAEAEAALVRTAAASRDAWRARAEVAEDKLQVLIRDIAEGDTA